MNQYFGFTWFERALSFFLYVGVLSFPFSVAAANLCFTVSLLLALFSGQLWQSLKNIRHHYPYLSGILISYFILMTLGLLWSRDVDYGLRVLSYQWIWLLVPLLAVCLQSYRRRPFLILLSLSLSLHLIFCVMQMQGWIHFTTGGSNQHDATGFIGHIAFGVIYGIWSALLILWGYRGQGYRRYGCWFLALWSVAMVFAAQGRSAYLVVIMVLLVILYRIAMEQQKKRYLIISMLMLAFLCLGIVLGPGKQRVVITWQGVVAAWQGQLAEAQPRWRLWFGAVEIMKTAPWYGVGTGGYPASAQVLQAERPELEPHLGTGQVLAHLHNSYMQSFVRWGILGAFLSLALFMVWAHLGWRYRWSQNTSACMVTISGVAMLVHGLSAPAMEEHFPAMMAAMVLGVGLAGLKDQD
ncbi:MAG: O-antigen ligase family protein [Mariprofundaceae bacterium]|nr:O-antigen ligase family protein [Mariprofundaceae bacterium]